MGEAVMSLRTMPRNFLGQNTEQVSVRERLANAFRRATAGLKSPAKVLAQTTGKTPEMAEKWLRGENAPNVEALIAACRAHDEVWEEFKELCGRGGGPSEAEAILAEFAQKLRERRIA